MTWLINLSGRFVPKAQYDLIVDQRDKAIASGVRLQDANDTLRDALADQREQNRQLVSNTQLFQNFISVLQSFAGGRNSSGGEQIASVPHPQGP